MHFPVYLIKQQRDEAQNFESIYTNILPKLVEIQRIYDSLKASLNAGNRNNVTKLHLVEMLTHKQTISNKTQLLRRNMKSLRELLCLI